MYSTASKSEQDEHVNEEEFNNVDNHPSERDLQRSQMRTDAEYVNRLQKTRTVFSKLRKKKKKHISYKNDVS